MTGDQQAVPPLGMRADARRNRHKVLQAALDHFSRDGISASLEDIARQAGVGAGTLYRHFPSREALLEATLGERQQELLAVSRAARQLEDADLALQTWLEALQHYMRTFNGLPAPLLAAVKERASPLALSCDRLQAITGEFLERAQSDGHARASVKANDLFVAVIAMAWALNRAETSGASAEALNELLSRGYLRQGAKDSSDG